MFHYTKQFFKESKVEFKALRDIGIPLFVYQSIIRLFILVIFGIFYSFFIYWILRNPGEDYVFLTGMDTLGYIHIDRLVVTLIFALLLLLLSLFIETFGVISLSRQYYLGKKVSLRRTFLDVVKYFRVNFKVQTLKYLYIFSNVIFLAFLLYVVFLFLPNIFGILIAIFLVIENAIIVVNKIVEYKDVGQRVFEGKKNIFEVYNYTLSRSRKKRIFRYYSFKVFIILFVVIIFPFLGLYFTWLISRISLNHEILASGLLGINSAIVIVIAGILSYLYISFFALRSTRKYLEIKKQKANRFQKYSKKNFSKYKKLSLLLFVIFSIFQGLFFYDYFHTNIMKEKKITIFAHRASMMSDTNNSLEALDYSIKNKVEYVEIDVQLSKEGIPVIFHDYTYFDGKQNKYILNTPLAELKQFDLKTYKNVTNTNKEPVPTLEEFLSRSKGKIKVNIEIKTTKNFEMELAEKVAQIIKKLGMKDEVMVTSFEHKILERIKEIIPGIKVGLIITAYIGEIEEIADMDVDWLMINNIYYTLYKDTFDSFEDKKIALWSFSSSFNGDGAIYMEHIDGAIVDDPVSLKKEIDYYNSLSVGEKYYRQIEQIFLKDFGF